MNFECENCLKEFTGREALCENWRDEKKSLICPWCKHYLTSVHHKEWKYYSLSLKVSFLSVFVWFCLWLASIKEVFSFEDNQAIVIPFGVVTIISLAYGRFSQLLSPNYGLQKTVSHGRSNL